MTSIFDKLKTLIESKINIQANSFINKPTYNINIINSTQEENPIKYVQQSDTYVINVAKLDALEKKTIKSICNQYVENNNILLEKKSADLLHELYIFKKTKHSTLEFFHEIIPSVDF